MNTLKRLWLQDYPCRHRDNTVVEMLSRQVAKKMEYNFVYDNFYDKNAVFKKTSIDPSP